MFITFFSSDFTERLTDYYYSDFDMILDRFTLCKNYIPINNATNGQSIFERNTQMKCLKQKSVHFSMTILIYKSEFKIKYINFSKINHKT